MTADEFMDIINRHVSEAAIEGTISQLRNPSGREPRQQLVESSIYYKGLNADDQRKVNAIIRQAVGHALFGMFSVLDGVKILECTAQGEFELTYVKNAEHFRLNNPNGEELHNLYNWYSRDQHEQSESKPD